MSRSRGMAVIALVARRELRERARSRSFMISTLFILLVVSGVGVLPALLEEDGDEPRRIDVVGLGAEGLASQLETSGAALHLEVVAVASDDAERSRRALLREEIGAVVFTDGRLFFRRGGDAEVARATQEALRAWLLPSRLEGLGLDAESAAALAAGPPLDVASLLAEPENESDRLIVAIGGVVLLLLAITTYGQWVLQGVVEEKTSRVVEVLLVTMRPYQLLAGKVLGIGLLGLAQLAVTVTLGLGVASAGGLIDLPDRAGALFALELLWFALGFAFYAVAYAAAGSLVSRQEEAANVALPVTIALMASYFIAFTAVLEDANGLVPRVATFVPLTAPIVIPARAAVGAVSAWEHTAALIIMLVSIYLLVRVAGRIYAGGVLRTGPTVRLRDAWRQRERPARP